MGRTQLTYRTRYQIIRKNLIGIYSGDKTKYSDLWNHANDLSAPSSTLPYGDTHAITTFCMILTMIKKYNLIKELFFNKLN